MKARVTAKIKNSPIMPVNEFISTEIIEFDDDSNVFGRALTFRKHYKKQYGEDIDLQLIEVEWL